MKARLAPFLVLLEARYAPLLFAVAPQAYAVYLWLMPTPHTLTGEFFAIMGGIGYEFIYVGAIAWAEEGRWSFWTWATAMIALLFSMAVAYYVYRYQGLWAWLHAGFPLVAFGYTMNMHAPRHTAPAVEPQAQTATEPQEDASAPLAALRARAREMRDAGVSWAAIAAAVERSPSTVRGWLES